MEVQVITLIAQAHDGTLTVNAEVPVPTDNGTYLVTITATPQPAAEGDTASQQRFQGHFGGLANVPMPEGSDDPRP